MTASDKRIDTVDGLRGAAILMVMLYHLHAWLPGMEKLPAWYLFPFSLGFTGVDFFFVLSGFSLYYAWLRREADSGTASVSGYYVRRFWRIYPPYIIAFIIPWIPLLLSEPLKAIEEAAWHGVLLHNYSDKYFYGSNGPLWSIAVEAQFYVLFPLIILIVKRFGIVPVVVAGILIGVVYRLGVYLQFSELSYRQVPKPYLQGFWLARIPNFLVGMLLASYWSSASQTDSGSKRNVTFILGLATLTLTWTVIFFARSVSMIVRDVGFAVGFGFITISVIQGGFERLFRSRWLVFIGKISFSLYLTHAPVILLFGRWYARLFEETSLFEAFSGMLVAMLLTFGVAWVFYNWIEIPFFNKARTYQ